VEMFETRVGAYAVIVRNYNVLLAHFNAYGESNWTLPGGGLELGEDGETAVGSEVHETGYNICPGGLLGIDSVQISASQRIDGRPKHLHSLRLIYSAQRRTKVRSERLDR
jgi:8-oxo-dGTP diphosphatase